MATQISLKHPAGPIESAYIGWSWTCFFFGMLPPLFRGDFKNFLIFIVVHAVLAVFTFGIGNLIFAFVIAAKYNEWHYNGLIQKGYLSQNN